MTEPADAMRTTMGAILSNESEQLEAYLLSLFGSVERARELAHLFVLEETPTTFTAPKYREGEATWGANKQWRLRLKTTEEMGNTPIE